METNKTNSFIIQTRNSNRGFGLDLTQFDSIIEVHRNQDTENPNLNWAELDDEAIIEKGLLINTYTFTQAPDFYQVGSFIDQNLNYIAGYLWRGQATDDDWDSIPEDLDELIEFTKALHHHNIINDNLRNHYLQEIQKVEDYLDEIIG